MIAKRLILCAGIGACSTLASEVESSRAPVADAEAGTKKIVEEEGGHSSDEKATDSATRELTFDELLKSWTLGSLIAGLQPGKLAETVVESALKGEEIHYVEGPLVRAANQLALNKLRRMADEHMEATSRLKFNEDLKLIEDIELIEDLQLTGDQANNKRSIFHSLMGSEEERKEQNDYLGQKGNEALRAEIVKMMKSLRSMVSSASHALPSQ